MKRCLCIGGFQYHYQKSYIGALERNGVKVYTPELLNYKETNRFIKFFYKDLHKRRFIEKQNGLYLEKLNEVNPDFVFIINDYFISQEFLEQCIEKNIPIYGCSIDAISFCNDAMEGNNIFDHLKYYDAFYSYEPTDVRYTLKKGKNVEYLPLGFDKQYFPEDIKNNVYKTDIFFCGSLDRKRIEILNLVAEFASQNGYKMVVNTSIQLKRFDSILLVPKILLRRIKFKIKYKYLYECIDNNYIGVNKLVEMYSGSKVCINIHASNNPEEHTGPNPRTFETLAAGSLLFQEKGFICRGELVQGREFVEYRDVYDLIEKLGYYLSNDDERVLITREGHNKVWKNFTQDCLVNRILKNEKLL